MKRVISVLLIFSLLFTFASCNNKKVDINTTTINNTTSNIETTTSMDKPAADDGTNISTILNGDRTFNCLSFNDGYAYVYNYETTYIIDTDGYICAEIPRDSEYGEIVTLGNKNPFYKGVSIICSNIDDEEITIAVDTSGNVINTWEECTVLAINEENLLCVVEYEETIDGGVEWIGTQNYKGEWVTGPFEWPYDTGPDWGSYKGHNIVKIRGGIWYYDMIDCKIYDEWREVPIKCNNLYFNTITPVNYAVERTKKGYWRDDDLVIDLDGKGIVAACDFVDGIGVFSTFNGSKSYFLSAIYETGKNIFEPIEISSAQADCISTYSEGYLPIWIYNEETYSIDRVDYIDKSGAVAFSIPGVNSTTSLPNMSVHNGIVTNGLHYYNTKGELLF